VDPRGRRPRAGRRVRPSYGRLPPHEPAPAFTPSLDNHGNPVKALTSCFDCSGANRLGMDPDCPFGNAVRQDGLGVVSFT
jgi:hypothetical protein